jgi:hypothetical protein
MKITVYFAPTFNKKYKHYAKKFRSLTTDLKLFLSAIETAQAIDLGGNIFKYRLAVKSKNKGKSGGFRIIALEVIVTENDKEITLLTIYDKSEQATVTKKEIDEILKSDGLR